MSKSQLQPEQILSNRTFSAEILGYASSSRDRRCCRSSSSVYCLMRLLRQNKTTAMKVSPRISLSLILTLFTAPAIQAFSPGSRSSGQSRSAFLVIQSPRSTSSPRLFVQQQQEQDTAFAAFAESLEEPETNGSEPQQKALGGDSSWQARLDTLLDPTTSLADRQVLLSELLSANEEIRDSVQEALRDGNIDSLLTPRGRRLQDGTRAVARQLTTDILPSLAKRSATPPSPQTISEVLPKIGSRVLNALGSQARRTLGELQSDLQDPSRIPQKLSQQTNELAKEAKNVFLETPEGLQGPPYKTISIQDGYEIREYPKYTVASTNMGKVGEPWNDMDDVTASGAAFNALAAYLFGANSDGKSMDMTTPVTTTSRGEMRFYLSGGDATSTMADFPQPLQDSSNSQYDTGAVQIVEIAAARLAVRKFPGFVTEGEVTRQKDTLLNLLMQDGVELDVKHGSPLPHIIFQYNPPYTIPMLRRNEIAIPVATVEAKKTDLETEWVGGETDNTADVSPSDVE